MRHDDKIPLWFKVAWWVMLAIGLVMTGLMGWLIYTAAMWLASHA